MYERNHNLVPELEPDYYELELMGEGISEPITLCFDDLKSFTPSHEVMTTIACAGNKRKSVATEFPNVKGLKWTNGAIGNALYKGVLVRDLLLQKTGLKESDLVGKGLHLVAISYDQDFQGVPYQVSIPLDMAMDPKNEIILAHEMNGQDLPYAHGYPVRLICPGIIAVRSAKWVNKLVISKEEADSAPQRRDYKIVKEQDMTKVNWSKYKPVMGNVINSAIAYPETDLEILYDGQGPIEISGWATGDGTKGTQVVKVEVSFDEGKTWEEAHDYIKE